MTCGRCWAGSRMLARLRAAESFLGMLGRRLCPCPCPRARPRRPSGWPRPLRVSFSAAAAARIAAVGAALHQPVAVGSHAAEVMAQTVLGQRGFGWISGPARHPGCPGMPWPEAVAQQRPRGASEGLRRRLPRAVTGDGLTDAIASGGEMARRTDVLIRRLTVTITVPATGVVEVPARPRGSPPAKGNAVHRISGASQARPELGSAQRYRQARKRWASGWSWPPPRKQPHWRYHPPHESFDHLPQQSRAPM